MSYQPITESLTPEACDLLIEARYVVPIEPQAVVLEHHAVAIRGELIVAVLPIDEARARFEARTNVSKPDGVLIPGLVNAHCHNPMTLMRGVADDLPLKQWLQEHIWPIEGAIMGPDYVADGIALAIAEMLRGGTTCCNENYFFPDVQAATYKRHGFRARVGLPVIDFPTAWAKSDDEYFDRAGEVHDQWRHDALIATAFAPHAPYTVSDANFERIRMLADQLDIPVHLHTHETAQEVRQSQETHSQRPIARLDRLGLINDRLIAVHMTQLADAEIALCAARGVSVVHCPESNLKLASGFCPVAKLQKAGVNVAIGTDGCASNNTSTCSARCAPPHCWRKRWPTMPPRSTPPARCAQPRWAAPGRWASIIWSGRSKPASRRIWCASICPRWKPSRCITCCRSLSTPLDVTRSATSGSPAGRSCAIACSSTWTSMR
jgi:5-methylthioadenosine/S-adenosylhomocysteine deaminase